MQSLHGTQIKHHGKQIVQFSDTLNKAKQPTLSVEMTTAENPWQSNNTVKMSLVPETELLDLCLFLHPNAKLNPKSQYQTQRKQANPKVLTIRVINAECTQFFIGLTDNRDEKIMLHRVFGVKQILTLRLHAFSRLAALYNCSVTDIKNMLESYL